MRGNGQIYGGGLQTQMPKGTQLVSENMTGLKPDTEYRYRIFILLYATTNTRSSGTRRSPNPARYFNTKFVAKPAVEFNSIAGVTLEARASPAPSAPTTREGLGSEAEAAYKTKWKFVCSLYVLNSPVAKWPKLTQRLSRLRFHALGSKPTPSTK